MSILYILLSAFFDRLRGGWRPIKAFDIDVIIQPRIALSALTAWLAIGEVNTAFFLWIIGFYFGIGASVGNSWICACVRKKPRSEKKDGIWQFGIFMKNEWAAVIGRGLYHTAFLLPAVYFCNSAILSAALIAVVWPIAAWLYGTRLWSWEGRGEVYRGALFAVVLLLS